MDVKKMKEVIGQTILEILVEDPAVSYTHLIRLLDNVRDLSEEQTLFETKLCLTHEQQADTLLIRLMAPLADYYV